MNRLVREYNDSVRNVRRFKQILSNASSRNNNAALQLLWARYAVMYQRYLDATINLFGALGNLSWHNKRLRSELLTSEWPPGRARNELNRRRTTFRNRTRREISGKSK